MRTQEATTLIWAKEIIIWEPYRH